ncbi:MTF1 [Candida oxycetoniae]|uniref:rRNA adenine N(6)-methyltransferase n=1 Tax=Candida oxycetoniae TaxID=497107 RepID=A0AAI9SWI1_9ASCO|nr:MTF1 [Candida oxycetoniae]KAI3404406.2 MTF1 [Candida oxycetoniae]
MSSSVALRSVNPALKEFYTQVPRSVYGKTQLISQNSCQKLLDKLNLQDKYKRSKLDIIDANPGFGLFSSMLNFELKPRNHILLERTEESLKGWKSKIEHLQNVTGNVENFKLCNHDPFRWNTIDYLYQNNLIPPINVQPRDKVHDELLIVANWSNPDSEFIVAQWLGCCGNRNWFMKYGNVRMLLFIPSESARKFLALPGWRKRNRTALKRDFFTESRLIGIGCDGVIGEGYDPRLLVRDQPVVIEKSARLRAKELALVEFIPGKYTIDSIEPIEHLLSQFYCTKVTLGELLPKLAPGAEYMSRYLSQELLNKSAFEFTTDDALAIASAYERWPFKPSIEEFFDTRN